MADQTIISTFSNAIAQGEGYGASATNLPTRTNNPGDIGNTGSATHAYATPEAGWAALDNQVASAFDGTSHVYRPNMTVSQFASTYAPGGTLAVNLPGFLGVPASTTLAQIASGQVHLAPSSRPATNASATPAYLTEDNDPATAVPVSGINVSTDQLAGILNAVSPSLEITTGLGQPSPLEDPGILQVNKATAAVGSPVTFQLYFDTAASPLPIVLSLNASLRTNQRTMRHQTSRKRTLTGILVDFWGMQPDQISGEASTGMFANQLGISDFLSLTNINSEVRKQALQAFQSPDMTQADILQSEIDSNPGQFRSAAKDAFVELLALFKCNGSVWFQNQNYTGYTTGLEQMAADAWSPSTGSSTFQNAARRNDVMTRGKVLMTFRNSGYFGYFKTFTWTMDAKNPFRWNFNFVFQVESTVTNLNLPTL